MPFSQTPPPFSFQRERKADAGSLASGTRCASRGQELREPAAPLRIGGGEPRLWPDQVEYTASMQWKPNATKMVVHPTALSTSLADDPVQFGFHPLFLQIPHLLQY